MSKCYPTSINLSFLDSFFIFIQRIRHSFSCTGVAHIVRWMDVEFYTPFFEYFSNSRNCHPNSSYKRNRRNRSNFILMVFEINGSILTRCTIINNNLLEKKPTHKKRFILSFRTAEPVRHAGLHLRYIFWALCCFQSGSAPARGQNSRLLPGMWNLKNPNCR